MKHIFAIPFLYCWTILSIAAENYGERSMEFDDTADLPFKIRYDVQQMPAIKIESTERNSFGIEIEDSPKEKSKLRPPIRCPLCTRAVSCKSVLSTHLQACEKGQLTACGIDGCPQRFTTGRGSYLLHHRLSHVLHVD